MFVFVLLMFDTIDEDDIDLVLSYRLIDASVPLEI